MEEVERELGITPQYANGKLTGEIEQRRFVASATKRHPNDHCCGTESLEHLKYILVGEWTKLSGRGKVYSFVIFHRAYHKAFEKDLPYAVAVIELAEGSRLLSNLVGIAPDRIRCDMPVEVIFEDITPDATLPKFRPTP